MITEIDKAWLAGIVDGEGSIILTRHPKADSLVFRVIVYNTNPIIAEQAKTLFESILGTPVRVDKIKRAKTHRIIYHVTVDCRDKVARILSTLVPYLRGKRREAEIVLAAYRLCPKRAGGWNRWGRRIPLSAHVDQLIQELQDERWGHSPVGNPEPSCAGAVGSAEGATATSVTPKNNPRHERAASHNLNLWDDEIA